MPDGEEVRYVSTGQCARAIGIRVGTLQGWVRSGLIEPDFRTAGGHMRWDVDRVLAELTRGLPRASEDHTRPWRRRRYGQDPDDAR